MPLYEYACKSCDHHFDIRHSADEKPEIHCPECGGEVRKVFHAAGIIFKGSGWYVTDSAKKSTVESAKPSEVSGTKAAKEETSEVTAEKSDSSITDSTDKKSTTTEKAAASV